MDLASRIEHIKPYFISFNVIAEESAAYAVVRFPNSWKIPNKTALKDNFKVEVAAMNEGICFVSEIENGSDRIFDAIDYVIDFNKEVEQRTALFNAKIKELGEVFASETYERLKTLKFVFEPQKKVAKKGKPKDVEPKVEAVEQATTEAEIKPDVSHAEGNGETDSSLMALAKNLTGE